MKEIWEQRVRTFMIDMIERSWSAAKRARGHADTLTRLCYDARGSLKPCVWRRIAARETA